MSFEPLTKCYDSHVFGAAVTKRSFNYARRKRHVSSSV